MTLDMVLTRCGQNVCGSGRAAAAVVATIVSTSRMSATRAVSEDRRGGDPGHMAVVGFEALDHDLALVMDGVDEKRATRADLGLDEEGDACERIGRIVPGQPSSRPTSISGAKPPRSAMTRDSTPSPCTSLGFGLQRLDDRGQRHDEGLIGDADHHAVEHGERQRQAHARRSSRGPGGRRSKCARRAPGPSA